LIFHKGSDILVAVSNSENVYKLKFVEKHPFDVRDVLCNAFAEWDCITVDEEKRIKLVLIESHPKIYIK
jgi:hypothetical protein